MSLAGFIPFDVASTGPSNPSTAVVERFPLTAATSFTNYAIVCEAMTAGSTWNVVLGEGGEAGTVPGPGATALAGQSIFAGNQPLPAPGTVATGPCASDPTAIWPAGLSLTLRIVTPAGGGVGLVKLVLR